MYIVFVRISCTEFVKELFNDNNYIKLAVKLSVVFSLRVLNCQEAGQFVDISGWFAGTPRKLIIADHSIRIGSLSVLMIVKIRAHGSKALHLRGVFTKLN